ncbi:MAG: hypothetical protein JKY37_21265, partial [Nannocystaceae bacterium]|nr:hypothetical protein [Nannocystaceae bacterium]
MQRGRAAALLVWASASACSEYDLPSLRYETEQAVIGTDISKPLCGYDLPWIDEQIEFTEGMLNAAADEKLEIYIYAKDVPEPCGGRAGVVGCYKPDEKIIASVWWAVDHEIVHAVADRFSDASVFWDEGIAEALRRGRPTIRGWIPVVQNASVDTSREVERFGAGHFVRWLINEYDIDTVRDLLTGTPPGEVTGNSLEDLSAMYESESMAAYPSWAPCDYPELANVGPGLWDETVEVSCRRPDVSRFGRFGEGAFTLLRSVELSGGRYEFKVSGGNVGSCFIRQSIRSFRKRHCSICLSVERLTGQN